MQTIKNLLWQFSGQGLGKVLVFSFYVFLPRLIGVEEYGKFSFALAVSFIVVQPILEMGLDIVVAKWVSRGKFDVIKKVAIIRLATAFIALLLLFITSLFLELNNKVLFTLFAYFVLLSFQNLIFSFFRGLEKMRLEGILTPIQKSFTFAFVFLFAFLGFRDSLLGPITLLSSVFLTVAILLVISSQQIKTVLKKADNLDVLNYKDLMKEGVVLGGVVFLWLIYYRIDSVMLGIMKGDTEVGIYTVAYKIMEGVIFIPGIIMIVFFPKLVKHDRFKEVFAQLLLILGITGIGASIGLYLFSSSIIKLFYEPEFFSSIIVLQTLSLALLPVFLGHLTTQSLVAMDLNRLYLYTALAGTLFNILLNYFLIPPFGAIGAAWATLVTETIIVVLCGFIVWKRKPGVFSIQSSVTAIKQITSPIIKK